MSLSLLNHQPYHQHHRRRVIKVKKAAVDFMASLANSKYSRTYTHTHTSQIVIIIIKIKTMANVLGVACE